MRLEIDYIFPEVKQPQYATDGSSGFDLELHHVKKVYTAGNETPDEYVDGEQDMLILPPKARALIGCGFRLAIPIGFEMQVRPRSGLALKRGITVLNSPGTVDSDYRGEVGIIIINHSHDTFSVHRGEAVAQGVIMQVYTVVDWVETSNLSATDRGEGGYGSTDNISWANKNIRYDQEGKLLGGSNQNY